MDFEKFHVVAAAKRDVARYIAVRALGRYKYWTFGHWASRWVQINDICS